VAVVSHRLKTAFEGALAGGGDPATSPLYVFGPYLKLLAASSAGAVCFGAPIWMVVATVIVVSMMYGHVMRWVPDGSGGSGLCEEEFGSWAVKINASITVIEYTLTFLVSIAALVTFVSDRLHGLSSLARTSLAIAVTLGVMWVVNRGPKLAARVFGPATAAVLLLLWVLVVAVIAKRGLHLPSVQLAAFSPANLHITLSGYVRLLALMTGIEVFANLVAAYDGPPPVRARKAFASLTIVMTTTLVTMVVVGPAVYELSSVHNTSVSVFTQTMDQLLPAPVAYAGTLIGIVVLLSAAAASAQGLQNLALGLRQRQYIKASFGQRNRFDVADRPVIAQALLVIACFVAFGTHEERYLALYAAGVFVLLGLTGWAAVHRLVREVKQKTATVYALIATVLAALVTSGAAALIVVERFVDGAWSYFVLVPVIYSVFSWYRARLGPPTKLQDRLGRVHADNKSFLPNHLSPWPEAIVGLLDDTSHAETTAIATALVAQRFSVHFSMCTLGNASPSASVSHTAMAVAVRCTAPLLHAQSAEQALDAAHDHGANLLVVSRESSEAKSVARLADIATLFVPSANGAHRYPTLKKVILGLDGSPEAEATLAYAGQLLLAGSALVLVLVPDGDLTAPMLWSYGEQVAKDLRAYGSVLLEVGGSGASRTLVEKSIAHAADCVLVARHGRGGVKRAQNVPMGSVAARLLQELECPLLLVPATPLTELSDSRSTSKNTASTKVAPMEKTP
jgi:nucleotide-binding universal stress UspA family protein